MKYYLSLFFGACVCFLIFPASAFADVKINEVAWMGTVSSQYSEWIELYNTSNTSVPLAGWKLYKTGDEVLFTLTKTIAGHGYLLVERTTASAPDAVPGINDEAGTFGSGGLKNSGEDLALKDKEGTVIDSISYPSGWPAGDAKTKETMQWDGQKWITATGTPDAATIVPPPDSVVEPVDVTPVASVQTPAVNPTTDSAPIITQQSPVTIPAVVPVETPPPISETNSSPTVTTSPSSSEQPPPAISSPVVTSPVQVKNATVTTPKAKTKKSSYTKSLAATADVDQTGEAAAAQLQDNTTVTDTPKENNHTKVIILAVVAFIGTALFLLLGRFKASQE